MGGEEGSCAAAFSAVLPDMGGELRGGILCGSPLHGREVARRHSLQFSPTWEGSCAAAFSAVLPAPVGEGSGVGSVLLFHMFAFDYSKSLLQK